MSISKILSIFLGLLLAATVVVVIMFYAGGNIEGSDTPVFTSTILGWAAVLLGIALVSVLLFFVIHAFGNLNMLIKSLVYIAILGVVVGIAYLMSSGTGLASLAERDISSSVYKTSDVGLFTMYILFGLAILSIAGSEIYRIFK